jgi:hypothetical protein
MAEQTQKCSLFLNDGTICDKTLNHAGDHGMPEKTPEHIEDARELAVAVAEGAPLCGHAASWRRKASV